MSHYIKLLEAIHAVKHLPRKGWIEHGLDEGKVESVAAHSFGTAALACILKDGGYFPGDIPFERVVKLALFHDIGESVIGDVTPADDVPAAKKATMERDAVRSILHGVPGLDALASDLDMLVSGQDLQEMDPVHALVKQVDKLDMMLQALLYERNSGNDLSDFYGDPKKYLSDEQLLAFFESFKQSLGL
jgi:putative hydrolase of HD superfamily